MWICYEELEFSHGIIRTWRGHDRVLLANWKLWNVKQKEDSETLGSLVFVFKILQSSWRSWDFLSWLVTPSFMWLSRQRFAYPKCIFSEVWWKVLSSKIVGTRSKDSLKHRIGLHSFVPLFDASEVRFECRKRSIAWLWNLKCIWRMKIKASPRKASSIIRRKLGMFQGKCLSVWLVMCKKSDKFNNFYELCGDINSEMTPFVLSYYMVSVYFISKHYLIFFLNLVKWLKPMIPNWD